MRMRGRGHAREAAFERQEPVLKLRSEPHGSPGVGAGPRGGGFAEPGDEAFGVEAAAREALALEPIEHAGAELEQGA